MERDALEKALLAAHDADDTNGLVDLYTLAADQAEQTQDIDAACFYLTHAFVFALESGNSSAQVLNKRLADRGRAKLLDF
ncbi:hypothetical protein P5P81_05345 [Tritonibacter mobilis]|nr:hypothetical protein [Tritonibacter mobilis]